MRKLLITIDGPAGAGKTTVSKALADRLGYIYVDTGALYRGVAYEARAAGISTDDDQNLEKLCQRLNLKFVNRGAGTLLMSGNTNITDFIRTPEMSMMASAVSARSVVRQALLEVQRKMGEQKSAVFEGRDMGTVVFPDADIKFFLTADLKARASRRYQELANIKPQPLEEVEKDMKRRDENDSSRHIAPLKPAADAVLIDSSHISAEAVIEKMITHIQQSFDRD
jgi:cytidylate kinase